jgi:dTDP-4-amino-4,6-dideoxygalactose transaminase
MSRLAILGGEPVRSKPWLAWPDSRREDVEAVSEVVRSGRWWRYAGSETSRFEQEFAAYQEARFGVAVSSGTTALTLALEAVGVGAGDEVIVPAYSFIASATSVLLANAVPIFADVERETMNLDPKSAAGAITPRTRAIMAVHFAGLPADMESLRELAAKHDLLLIEDCAQAHGAVLQGRKVGAIGEAGAFSFQVSKNLCAGEGGIILTDREGTAARAESLHNCGRVAGRPSHEHHLVGGNFRITEMQSALLRSRLRSLEAETARRFRNGRRLTEKLRALPGLRPLDPEPREGDRRAYHLFPICYEPEALGGLARERFMEAVSAEGAPCGPGYLRPIYRNPAFAEGELRRRGPYAERVDYREVSCPVAEEHCRNAIWLFHNLLLGMEEDVEDIADAFEKVCANHRELVEFAG